MRLHLGALVVSLVASSGFSGCASQRPMRGYATYLAHMPRSIVVLPPRNHSNDPAAGSHYLPTITRPLAELGYYVFPIPIVDQALRERGARDADAMYATPPATLVELFGADAAFYTTVEEWGIDPLVFQSRVSVSCRLVDLRSGLELWSGQIARRGSPISPFVGMGRLLHLVAAGFVEEIAPAPLVGEPQDAVVDHANEALGRPGGLLMGPLHPEYRHAAETAGR